MASAQIQTTSSKAPFGGHAPALALAGSREWSIVQGGGSGSVTGLTLRYSDDNGANWTVPTGGSLDAGTALKGTLCTYQLAGVWKLAVAWGGSSGSTDALKYAEITSNVSSGTPGAITTATVDAGGANAGVNWPSIFATPSASNPRLWIVAEKYTGASAIECRAWYIGAPGGAGAWTTTNFTNLGATSSGSAAHFGAGSYWTVSAAAKATIILMDREASPLRYKAYTFDPSAATPTPGSAANIAAGSSGGFPGSMDNDGPTFTVVAKADYLVFARYDSSANTWSVYKSVDGITFSVPSGWSGLTAGRMQLSTDGADFYLIHGTSFGDEGTTASALLYRKITAASDAMGSTAAFSDTNGNPVAVPQNTGTTKLYAVYRAGTSSTYSVRADFVSIAGGGAPTNSVLPAVTGTTTVGQTLSVSNGTWTNSPSSYAYQWQRDQHNSGTPADIAAATSSTYVLTDADNVCNVRCVVTATNGSGSASAASATVGLIAEPAPGNAIPPLLSGDPTPGGLLLCDTGTWLNMGGFNPFYTYSVKRADDSAFTVNVVELGLLDTYIPTLADLGKYLRVDVTANNQ